jgi:hypothetical protein
MRDVAKHKAARLAGEGGFGQWGAEACGLPQLYSSTTFANIQDAILAEAERASELAHRLAVRHILSAEQALDEAERLSALARALKSEALA